jgi:peptide/nickel transport system permease protein
VEGEAYVDIVWKQFRRHRAAVRMLWIVAALFAVSLLAPLLASNQPFWFREKDRLLFPWFVALVNPETAIDFVFNAGLILAFPCAVAAWVLDRLARRAPARRRALQAVVAVLGSLALGIAAYAVAAVGGGWRILAGLGLAAFVAAPFAWARWGRFLHGLAPEAVRGRLVLAFLPLVLALAHPVLLGLPNNKYFDRDFKKDQVQGKGAGAYTLVPYGPLEQDLDIIYKRPFHRKAAQTVRYRETQMHLMGTDDSGRDVFTRILYGTRISMTIGIVAVSIYLTLGLAVGAVAGYFGGKIDMLISRIVEIVMLFPSFFLILTLVALIGPSLYIIMVVIGLTGWPTIARLTRGEFLRQRAIDYVSAARALGASNPRVMFRHILPNALSPCLVAVPFGIAGAIVTEESLSVLGFGARPPAPSWGAVLNLAVFNYEMWWLTVFAGLAIFVTVTVFNVVGNGLRDAMDPRLKGTQ